MTFETNSIFTANPTAYGRTAAKIVKTFGSLTIALLVACGGTEYQPAEFGTAQHEVFTVEVGSDRPHTTKKIHPEVAQSEADEGSTNGASNPTGTDASQPAATTTAQQAPSSNDVDVRPDSDFDVPPKTPDELQAYDLSRRVTGGEVDADEVDADEIEADEDTPSPIAAVVIEDDGVEVLTEDELEEMVGPTNVWTTLADAEDAADLSWPFIVQDAEEVLSGEELVSKLRAAELWDSAAIKVVLGALDKSTRDSIRVFDADDQWLVYRDGRDLVVTAIRAVGG